MTGTSPIRDRLLVISRVAVAVALGVSVTDVTHGARSPDRWVQRLGYRDSLRLLREAGGRSIAFPAIATGIFGYPPDRATRIALRRMREETGRHAAGARHGPHPQASMMKDCGR